MNNLPPSCSVETEAMILGALLLDNDAYDRLGSISEADFFREDHRVIFAAIKAIIEAGKPCDVVLLSETLAARGELDRCGGTKYIGELAINTASAANVHRYAALVRRHAQSRALQAHATDLHEAAAAPGHDPVKIAERSMEQLLSIVDAAPRGEIRHISEVVGAAVDWLDSPVKGLSTGYGAIDHIIGGLRPGDLIVIAGRPSMGKSSLAACIVEHVSTESPVALFSLEMPDWAITARSVRWHEHLRDRDYAVRHLWDKKLWIDDSSPLSLGVLRVRLQRIKRKHGLALAVVDYLQLMTGQGDNREQEIASLSRGLKYIAMEFDIPVVVVAQLNRSVEGRQDKRPLLSDIRESGAAEQDADLVMMLYRDEYYYEDSPAKGFCEVIVRKHRNGGLGTAHLIFVPEYARFRDFTGTPPQPPRPPRRGGNIVDYKQHASGNESA